MNAKHTPGPWRIGDAGYTIFGPPTASPSPRTVARIPKLALPCTVAAIDENIANARLIAAAPELLAACCSALRALRDNLQPGPLDGDAVTSLELVISKATGKEVA